MQSGKRVQQTMVLDSPKGLSNCFCSEFCSIFIVFINDFHHDFWIPWHWVLTIWDTISCKSENTFSKHCKNKYKSSAISQKRPKCHSIFIWIRMVCWTRFLNSKKVSFPIGKLNFLQSGKRVQQTMVLDSPKGRPNYFCSESCSIFIVFINDFIMISEFQGT